MKKYTIKQIRILEAEIDREVNAYETCLKYPTETDQFYAALEKNRIQIDQMKNKLQNMVDNKLKLSDLKVGQAIRHHLGGIATIDKISGNMIFYSKGTCSGIHSWFLIQEIY